jgi:hypothetical protein
MRGAVFFRSIVYKSELNCTFYNKALYSQHLNVSLLKRFAIILLIPIVLLQTCAGLFIMTAFYANQDYIAKNLCINRNTKMAPLCSGRCILVKELKKEQDQDKKNAETKLRDFQPMNRTFVFLDINPLVLPLDKPILFSERALPYIAPSLASIFHPPLV